MSTVIRKGRRVPGAAAWFHVAAVLAVLLTLAGPAHTARAAADYLHTSGNRIVDSSGATVGLSGLNWFGFESANYAPHGLWSRNWGEMLDQVRGLGYNVIRLPFSNQMLDPGVMPNGIDYSLNPDLAGLTALQVMDRIVAGAGARGIRILLDNHRSSAGPGPESNGLWYTDAYPESRWVEDWRMLAQRYQGNATVVGMDLRNEPHAACWGCGDAARDWRLAAEQAGNAILSVNSDLLILVEGVSVYNGQTTWWGGNLMGARDFPVRLNVAERLVYSPHEYPASIHPQSWFNDPAFPNNLPAIWDAYWGYLAPTTPILIGEFGTRLETEADRQWFQKFSEYIRQKQLHWTFWSLNPNSGDTGGLLLDDWTSVHQEKQGLLGPMQYAFIGADPSPATPTSAPTEDSVVPGPAWMLDDFESGGAAAWTRFQGVNSSVAANPASPGQAGAYALQVDYWIGSDGWGGVGRDFAAGQDWSGHQSLSFGFQGVNSGNLMRFEILDNRGGSGDTAERFEYKFTDNFSGWMTFDLPWSAFARRADWQPDGAPNDGLTLNSIWGYNLSPVGGGGSFQLDQIVLKDLSVSAPTAAPPPASPTPIPSTDPVHRLDDFESGNTGEWSAFRDSNSSINAGASTPGHSGQYGLQITYAIAAEGWGGLEVRLAQPQDWSGTDSFDLWFRGTGSGNTLRLEVYENRSDHGSDTSERFEHRFTDSFSGWQRIHVPWWSFSRRADWQPFGAPDDGFNRSQVWGYSLSPLGGQGSFQVDDLQLLKP